MSRSRVANAGQMAIVRRVALLLGFIIFSGGPVSVSAAEGVHENPEPSAADISQGDIEEFIATIENESERQQFIDNLEALTATYSDTDTQEFRITNFLNVDEASGTVLAGYVRTLRNLGLSDSMLSKSFMIAMLLAASLLIIFVNNKLSYAADDALDPLRGRLNLDSDRFSLIFWSQRCAGYLTVCLLIIYTVASIITSPGDSLVFLSWGTSLAGYAALAIFLLLLFAIAWESPNAALEFYTRKSSRFTDSRVQTLIPVARNIMFVAIMFIGGMVVVSELGVDLVPLLAGAGVVGVAVGFGAQTMIKDFLNGFILVFEDLMQVGDIVTLSGRTGKVERITLRKVQLRALDGTVNTIPHSEITIIENLTKDHSYYLLEVGVAYKEETDSVIDLLQAIDKDLRESEEFGASILEEIEVLGVDGFGDSAVVIKARMKTRPHDKWKVGREFNRRMKICFDKEGIEIPFPHRTLYFGNTPGETHAEGSGDEAGDRNHRNQEPDSSGSGSKPDKALEAA